MSRIIGFSGVLTSASFAASALDIAIRVAVVLAVALIATRALRRSSAAVRHSVLSAAIAAALVLPLFAAALPRWQLPIPGAEALGALVTRTSSRSETSPALRSPAAAGISAITAAGANDTGALSARAASGSTVSVPASPATIRVAANAPIAGRGPLRRDRLPSLIVSIWALGFLVALIPLLLGRLQLRAIVSRAREVESDVLDDFVARLARSSGIRRVVRLVEGTADETPMTWGIWRPIVLVPRGFASWPEPRQREVLLHELAHVARYDCLTQLLGRVVCALHWFDPLAWIAARRMRMERERACDDRVLLAGVRPSEYADHILAIARSLRPPAVAGAAALAMARPSHLEGRLLALLDQRRSRDVVSRRRAATIGACGVLVAAAIATLAPWSARRADAAQREDPTPARVAVGVTTDTDPTIVGRRPTVHDSLLALLRKLPDDSLFALLREARNDSLVELLQRMPSDSVLRSLKSIRNDSLYESLQALLDSAGGVLGSLPSSNDAPRMADCTPGAGSSSSTSVSENDSHMKASLKHGDCEITLESEGKIGFDDAFTDITSVEKGGWVTIADAVGPTTHRLRIVADAAGKLSRTWSVNGAERPYDAQARNWLAATLRELDRHTNFSRGARVSAIYRARGVDGVLDEAASTGSDHGKRTDIQELLRIAKLDPSQTERVLGFVTSDMASDYDKSQLLRSLLNEGLVIPALQPKFISAAATIGGSYERRQVLTEVVRKGGLSAESQSAVLTAARRITSDHDMRELLLEVVKNYGLGSATAPAFLEAASRIGSDYDLRTLLTTAMNARNDLAPAIVDSFVDLGAKNIESDHDKAELLIAVARGAQTTEATRDRIAKIAESIGSRSDRDRVSTQLRRLKEASGDR